MKKLVLVALAFSISCVAADSGLLRGVVADAEGAPVSDVLIVVHRDGAVGGFFKTADERKKLAAVVLTDREGKYAVDLAPGFYDVFISASAFEPVCRKVRVLRDRTVEFSPRLLVSGAVSAEIGDRFESVPEQANKLQR